MTQLLTVTAQGLAFKVDISDDGVFSATYDDEVYESKTLEALKAMLAKGVRASRVKAPYISLEGKRGVVRGFHADKRQVLITREDGSKAQIASFTPVFRPEDITDEEVAELKSLLVQEAQIRTRRKALEQKSVPLEDLLNDTLGENITGSYTYERRLKERQEAAV